MKKFLITPIIVFFAFSTFLTLTPQSAFACSCVANIPQSESFAHSDAVFSGRVLSFNTDTSVIGLFRQYRKAEIEVSEVWKGDVQSPATVITGISDGDCGFDFVEGKSYLFYAQKGKVYGAGRDMLETGICNRTQLLAKADEDLALLGEGSVPKNGTEYSSTMNTAILWSGASLLVFLGALMVFWPKQIIVFKQYMTRKIERAEYTPSGATTKIFRIIGIAIIVFGLFVATAPYIEKGLQKDNTPSGGGETATQVLYGIVRGRIVRAPDPLCPTKSDPADPACGGQPIKGTFNVVQNFITNETYRQFVTNVDGTFEISLPPGEYGIETTEPFGSDRRQGRLIEVRANEITEVTITFDTGIR